jgi:3-oxoadipate enol-lactonase
LAKLAEAIRDFDLKAQFTSTKTQERVIDLDADKSGDRFDQECKNRNTSCVDVSLVEETQRFTALLETFLRENV